MESPTHGIASAPGVLKLPVEAFSVIRGRRWCPRLQNQWTDRLADKDPAAMARFDPAKRFRVEVSRETFPVFYEFLDLFEADLARRAGLGGTRTWTPLALQGLGEVLSQGP